MFWFRLSSRSKQTICDPIWIRFSLDWIPVNQMYSELHSDSDSTPELIQCRIRYASTHTSFRTGIFNIQIQITRIVQVDSDSQITIVQFQFFRRQSHIAWRMKQFWEPCASYASVPSDQVISRWLRLPSTLAGAVRTFEIGAGVGVVSGLRPRAYG